MQDLLFFQGNECRKLLKNTHLLLELLPDHLYDYYTAFLTFDAVVQSCFGNELYPNYKQTITDFERAYEKLGLFITPKIHLLVEHAIEDIESHGLGLGIFNESTAESIHADFDKHWGSYKVKKISADSYVNNLQSAVVAYNSNHL